jgi:TonB family protein
MPVLAAGEVHIKAGVKSGRLVIVGLFLLAVVPCLAEETDPVPGLKKAIMEQLGIELDSCPREQAARFLEQNYHPYCGTAEPDFIKFSRRWGKELGKHPKMTPERNWSPLPDDLMRAKFWYGAKPGFVLFNEKTGALLLGMDMSFADCYSVKYHDPEFAEGALLPGVDGVSEPDLVNWVPPQYPARHRMRGHPSVTFQAVIDQSGVPVHVCMLDVRQPDPLFMAAAMTAVKQWRFMPAMKDGRPVKVLWTNTFSVK